MFKLAFSQVFEFLSKFGAEPIFIIIGKRKAYKKMGKMKHVFAPIFIMMFAIIIWIRKRVYLPYYMNYSIVREDNQFPQETLVPLGKLIERPVDINENIAGGLVKRQAIDDSKDPLFVPNLINGSVNKTPPFAKIPLKVPVFNTSNEAARKFLNGLPAYADTGEAFKTHKKTVVHQWRKPSLPLVKLKPSNILVARNPVRQDRKYLIYRCYESGTSSLCGDLGELQIGIVASFLLARATDRTFRIIMDDSCKFHNFITPNTYNWRINLEDIKYLTSKVLYARNNIQFANSLSTMDFNEKYPQNVVYILDNHEYHTQLWRNKLYKKKIEFIKTLPKSVIYQIVLNTLFKLHPKLQKKTHVFLQRARPSPKRKLLCANVLVGKSSARQPITMGDLHSLWNFLDGRDNISKVFVTSDSLEVVSNAKKRFRRRFITTESVFSHVEKTDSESICGGIERQILDQEIFIECDTLVVSSGSSGYMLSLLKVKPGVFLFQHGAVHRL